MVEAGLGGCFLYFLNLLTPIGLDVLMVVAKLSQSYNALILNVTLSCFVFAAHIDHQ